MYASRVKTITNHSSRAVQDRKAAAMSKKLHLYAEILRKHDLMPSQAQDDGEADEGDGEGGGGGSVPGSQQNTPRKTARISPSAAAEAVKGAVAGANASATPTSSRQMGGRKSTIKGPLTARGR
uniref:Uncharacterized protein n=1 Tax=Chromera velia CCMP2878 TaxID=1169474 RepID=A0A0G4GP91_9ALVE|eukprot:Cvel_5005.t1-p1 / transcript=Cvel_5005.t1 / gene=Cvel_5005 / organism=Chromera_velia_CCMP2878 / gene_product=hypothetical protein / transcript_product=hypothetical protein / location=Cvel_scaffold227:325-1206(+) / protein_length=123 / sequence_SO=supercontig / SO=protein_coding / is_pseudo=false